MTTEIMKHFAESLKEAARIEREKCCRDICAECKDVNRWSPAERENERRWIHRWTGGRMPAENHCLATAIRERIHQEISIREKEQAWKPNMTT